ncbi:MAG: RNAse Z [Verrucomicrobiae bacterium]|nr:RNAse Z [Verrucomicrobiae bacterium]
MNPGATLTLTGYSTALFSTWWFVDDLSLMLDCGDGACAALMQKSRKARTIAVSHSDRDHLAGLPQFLQLNVREKGLPVVLYPRDCTSFPILRDFLHDFDRFHLEAEEGNLWKPMTDGSRHVLGKGKATIEAIANRHIECGGSEVKSLSYRVTRNHQQLKPEFRDLDNEAIVALREERGAEAIMDFDSEIILTYSADTPIESAEFWDKTKLLIHESTFLTRDDCETRRQELRHSALDEVMPMATELNPEALVLGHFSTRYRRHEIREAILRECRRCRPSFPVFAVLPGEIRHDLLRKRPTWEP